MGRQNLGRVEEKVTSEVPKRRRSTGRDAQGLKSLRRNRSFAPSGLNRFRILPTARAVGFNLAPLRGCLRTRSIAAVNRCATQNQTRSRTAFFVAYFS